MHDLVRQQCTCGDDAGPAISLAGLRQLEQAGTGDGVNVRLLTARPAVECVLAVAAAGNTAQRLTS